LHRALECHRDHRRHHRRCPDWLKYYKYEKFMFLCVLIIITIFMKWEKVNNHYQLIFLLSFCQNLYFSRIGVRCI